MHNAKQPLSVIKVGGAVVEDDGSLDRLLDAFAALTGPKVLVHGGGRSATSLASELGVPTVMVEGRRVTDDAMLRVVTMVYGGLVNKNLVARLQAKGLNAIGLTGADLGIIRSRKRTSANVDFGWVGDVECVDGNALGLLIDAGAVPVIAPLTHDGAGHMLNTNADTMASAVAKGLASDYDVRLVYCFEKPGVLADPDDDSSVIHLITPGYFESLKAQGTVSGGMIPKLDNAFEALQGGVGEVVITSADSLADVTAGTSVRMK